MSMIAGAFDRMQEQVSDSRAEIERLKSVIRQAHQASLIVRITPPADFYEQAAVYAGTLNEIEKILRDTVKSD